MRRVEFRLNRDKSANISISALKTIITENSHVSDEEVNEIIKDIEQHNFDRANNQGIVVFVIPSKNGYGFNIYQVKKVYNEKEKNYIYSVPENYKPRYENYEDVNVSFFDGNK